MTATLTHDDVRANAQRLGADLVGFASVADLECVAPTDKRPSTLARNKRTLIVFAKRTLKGIAWSRHLTNKQFAGARAHRLLSHIAGELAQGLEEAGHVSLPLHAAAFDFNKRNVDDLTPAGQGSYLLRLAAVQAGLGTWGLNTMVLTPEYGPRVFLGGVLTALDLSTDRHLPGELCLGLEACGRCAAVCPERAIPLSAPAGAGLHEVCALDGIACARSSQPFGYANFESFLVEIAGQEEASEKYARAYGQHTVRFWSEMAAMKEGAVTGCMDCVQVCPVGQDYAAIAESPHRANELPSPISRRSHDGIITLEHIGPAVPRKYPWYRRKSRT